MFYNEEMFKLEDFAGKRILKSTFIENEGAFACFTTRDLPLKQGEREDLADEIQKNIEMLASELNIEKESVIIPIQTHSDNVKVIKEAPRACARHQKPNLELSNTDALVTNQRKIALALNFADCVPIIFYDPIKKIAAIAHAGWRGTAAKISQKTIRAMIDEFDSSPRDIVALIGPAIGGCCFEVGEDVKQKILDSVNAEEGQLACKGDKIDLKLINKFQILATGVEKIDLCEDCTCCNSELFFSYRNENGHTARHSAVIMIEE